MQEGKAGKKDEKTDMLGKRQSPHTPPSLSSKARINPAVKFETREGDIIALPSDQARWEAEAGALKSEACAPSSPSLLPSGIRIRKNTADSLSEVAQNKPTNKRA